MNTSIRYEVVHTHNGHHETRETRETADRACAREQRRLAAWVNAPHGGNRNALVGAKVARLRND